MARRSGTTPSKTDTAPGSRLVLHGIAVALLSAYPLSLILRANLGVVPIGAGTLFWVLAVDLMLAAALFFALRPVTSDVAGRAVWLGVFFLAFGAYSVMLQLSAALGWPLLPERPGVAVGYTLLCILIATVSVRPWRIRKRDPIPLLMVGVILFGTNAVVGISRAFTFGSVAADETHGWKPEAAALVERATSAAIDAPPPARDIYYIVLDGFGRTDNLRRIYDLDLSGFVDFLRSKGFQVPERARSNYGQTYLSLAATLNMGYLDGVAAAVGRNSPDRTPLEYLVDRNALLSLAKRRGYHIVGIGSDYIATEDIPGADVCRCDQYGSSSTEQAIFASTPLVAISLGPRAFNAHRRKVREAFRALEEAPPSSGRTFVLAHILAPHPPFVFLPDGSPAPTSGLFMFQDGSHFVGTRDEYRLGYRQQAEFVVRQLRSLVETLLSRPGPPPVIIVHGDHGPGFGLDWASAERTDLSERLGIFAAFYLPEARELPYDSITPVNGARLVANAYLGANLPRLEDKSFYSTWERPYDLVLVSEP